MGMEMELSRNTGKCRHRHGNLSKRARVGLLVLEVIAEKEHIGGDQRGERGRKEEDDNRCCCRCE